MFGVICAAGRKSFACAAAVAAAAVTFAAPSTADAAEIVITVKKFHALDKADELSPDWKLTLPAKSGKNDVNLSLIDKDVSVDDPIDINRLPNKRDLDFTVDTRSCRIEGFAETYKCGQTITRAGEEKKKASISFTVDVTK
jgi:hypothetical protein